MKMKRLLSVLLAVVLVVSGIAVTSSVVATGANVDLAETSAYADMLAKTSAENDYGLSETVNDGTILQAWNWSFKNIKSLLPTLAEQGFTTIQVSPPNVIKKATAGAKVIQDDNQNGWWMFYQPAGFELNNETDNALGTKAQFTDMCTEAKKYGIKIIVDAVINHMGTKEGDDTNTSTDPMSHVTPKAAQYEPEIYNNKLFHTPWEKMTYKEDPGRFSQYESTYDLTRNCTSGLPDLKTEDSRVQTAIYDYLAELIEAGASGFRFDAAKHIETSDDLQQLRSDFWKNTLLKVRQNYPDCEVYAYGEILNNCGVNRPFSMYTKLFDVTDSGSYWSIKDAVVSGGNADATPYYPNSNFTSANTVLWDESHDTYVDGATTSLNTTQRGKIWALVAGRAGISCVYLARPSDSTNTNDCKSITLGEAKKTSWANATTKAINRFHNYYIGKSEYCTSNQNGWAFIERGDTGCIIIRRGSSTSGTFTGTNHKLKAGTYVDAITGNKFTVTKSQIKGNVGNTGVACIYEESEITPTQQPTTEKPTETQKPTETEPPTERPTVFGEGQLMGDVDQDNGVSILDATKIQRVLAGLAQKTMYYDVVGDVNQDQDVAIDDATYIQRYLAGMKDPNVTINVPVGGGILPDPTTAPTTVIEPTYEIPTFAEPTYEDPTYEDPTYEDPTYPDEGGIPHRDGCYTVIFSNSQGWTGSINLYYWATGEDGPNAWPGDQMEFYDTNEFNQAQWIGFVPEEYDNFIVSAGSADNITGKTVDCSISGDVGLWADTDTGDGWTVGTWEL